MLMIFECHVRICWPATFGFAAKSPAMCQLLNCHHVIIALNVTLSQVECRILSGITSRTAHTRRVSLKRTLSPQKARKKLPHESSVLVVYHRDWTGPLFYSSVFSTIFSFFWTVPRLVALCVNNGRRLHISQFVCAVVVYISISFVGFILLLLIAW